MVQVANYGKLRLQSELPIMKPPPPMKLEIRHPIEDEHGQLAKRPKLEICESMPSIDDIPYSLLNEPSPLGLRLRKSPSLLDLIQMGLYQAATAVNSCVTDENLENEKKKDTRYSSTLANTEKMKASNFPASLLRIGTWEYSSRYEGDLVAKFYFAKRKLVWEVLEGGLKSKIEFQWSDITALKAICPEDGLGTLEIVLTRQPLFFRETNPQPRKHTSWQAASDFTDGQASIYRRHILHCPQGLLSKQFEKLIQCDPRLCALSHEPDILLDSPFFERRFCTFSDQDESKCNPYGELNDSYESVIQALQDPSSTSAGSAPSARSDISGPGGVADIHTPNLVVDFRLVQGSSILENSEKIKQSCWDQLKASRLEHTVSISDIVNQLENCISDQVGHKNPEPSSAAIPDKEMLDLIQCLFSDSHMHTVSISDIVNQLENCISDQVGHRNPEPSSAAIPDKEMLDLVQCLFSDSHMPASEERPVMSKVNSFCNLLQNDAVTFASQQMKGGVPAAGSNYFHTGPSENNNAAGISRKDLMGDLLIQLPRIASVPRSLFNVEGAGECYTSN